MINERGTVSAVQKAGRNSKKAKKRKAGEASTTKELAPPTRTTRSRGALGAARARGTTRAKGRGRKATA